MRQICYIDAYIKHIRRIEKKEKSSDEKKIMKN